MTFIVAEAGVNHNGSLALAKKMVSVAKDCGADAIKFQTFKAESLVRENTPKADYQKFHPKKAESQFQMLKNLELDEHMHRELIRSCQKNKITFMSSAFDLESIDLLVSLGLDIFKIPSGEITNLPYLRRIGSLKKKIIMSCGMADMSEISDALGILIQAGTKKDNIILLHCNTDYPTPYKDVNLKVMLSIRDKFKVKVGYSDHTLGIEVPIAAVSLGAEVIEKHFTLDRRSEGPDHKASLMPVEMSAMVRAIRNIEKALGDGIKKVFLSERKNKGIVRKSIVASKYIRKGDVFSQDNLTVKRPADGVSAMMWDYFIGKRAERDYNIEAKIEY